MKSLIRVVHGREALPVRAIPYVAGRFFLPPDEVVKQLARKIAPPFARLQTTTAFHVAGGEVVDVLPREWDDAVASSEALESRLKRLNPSDEEDYAAWIEESKRLLPAAVFVWRESFEKDFLEDIQKIPPEQIRKGDDALNFSPRLSNQEREWILDGVFRICQSIDWKYWQQVGLVRAWEAVAISCGINPRDNDLDVDDLVNNHPEVKKRLRLLLKTLSNRDYFSPVTLDGKQTAMVLAEFAAWWIQTQDTESIPNQLALMGEPLVYARQDAAKKLLGRYTLEEAAEDISKNAGERNKHILNKLKDAALSGDLLVYEPGRNARYDYGPTKATVVREFYEEACWDDLNTWLKEHEPRINYQFPEPMQPSECDPGFEASFTETVYNGHAINMRYWVKDMPTLDAAEAARLMSALDPDVFESLDHKPNDNDSTRARTKARKIQRMAERQGKEKATPKEWLNWADGHGLHVHSGFRIAIAEIEQEVNFEEQSNTKNEKTTGVRRGGLTKRAILAYEWPGTTNLDNVLSDVPKWLKDAKVTPGKKGKNGSALWNPALIAFCLHDSKNVPLPALDKHIQSRFPEWLDEWQEKKQYFYN